MPKLTRRQLSDRTATRQREIEKGDIANPGSRDMGLKAYKEIQVMVADAVARMLEKPISNEPKVTAEFYEDRIHNSEERFSRALDRLTNVFEVLVSSITPQEIMDMPAKERFQAINKTAIILKEIKGLNQNAANTIFSNVSIYNQSAESLEKTLVDYTDVNVDEATPLLSNPESNNKTSEPSLDDAPSPDDL